MTDDARQWVDTATGEIVTGACPLCAAKTEWAEGQVRAMELERRRDRAARTKAERAAEHATVARRDGSLWNAILAHWLATFPDKRPSAKGIKSARATKFFMRLDSGATVQDVQDAVLGAKRYPYVVYGQRRSSGSKADLRTDLEDICAINRDGEFDLLVAAGREVRLAKVPA